VRKGVVRKKGPVPIPKKVEMVYLGGPIDFALGDAHDWREAAAAYLLEYGIASFSPAHAFKAPPVATPGTSERLMEINFSAIYYSDLLLMNLGTTMSVGTSREIQQAAVWNKAVIAILDRPPGHYLVDTWVCSNLDEALQLILEHGIP
jgi:nucleoside 2-deoxyribosyltransferase